MRIKLPFNEISTWKQEWSDLDKKHIVTWKIMSLISSWLYFVPVGIVEFQKQEHGIAILMITSI